MISVGTLRCRKVRRFLRRQLPIKLISPESFLSMCYFYFIRSGMKKHCHQVFHKFINTTEKIATKNTNYSPTLLQQFVLGSIKFCHLSFIYIQQCKSNNVVKKKKFNIRACNMHGLITYIKKELLNQDLEKLDVGNFLFTKQT